MSHTPGPWKYTTNVGPTKALIVEGDGSTVVEVCNRTRDSRFIDHVRLMTAAPDLLDALRDALAFLDRPDITTYEWYRLAPEHVGRFRRAINKAEGRP